MLRNRLIRQRDRQVKAARVILEIVALDAVLLQRLALRLLSLYRPPRDS